MNENILFLGHISKFKRKIDDFYSNYTKKLPKIVLKAIFPSASSLKKEGGALIRGGALNAENTVGLKSPQVCHFRHDEHNAKNRTFSVV